MTRKYLNNLMCAYVLFVFFFFFGLHCVAYEILILPPGIKLMLPVVKQGVLTTESPANSLNNLVLNEKGKQQN